MVFINQRSYSTLFADQESYPTSDDRHSYEVKRDVKREVGLYGFPKSWNLIMVELQANRGPGKLIQKLALAATIYHIWRERNSRIFRNFKQIAVKIFKLIMACHKISSLANGLS